MTKAKPTNNITEAMIAEEIRRQRNETQKRWRAAHPKEYKDGQKRWLEKYKAEHGGVSYHTEYARRKAIEALQRGGENVKETK